MTIRRRVADLWWVVPAAWLFILSLVAFVFTPADGFTPGFSAVPLDDAWIHFVYAREALTTGLLHYQDCQPAAGTSSLLWVLLLATPIKLGLYAPIAAKLFGLLCQLGLAAMLWMILARVANRPLAALGALAMCADPMAMFASLSGMETMLYTALAFGAAAALLADRPKLAGWLAGAAVIARPDGALLAGLIATAGIAHAILQQRRTAGGVRIGRTAFVLLAPSLLLGLFWTFLNWRAIGHVLPASFYVRAGGLGFFTRGAAFKIAGNFAHAGVFIGHPSQWLLYALGLLWIIRRRDVRYAVVVLFPWLLIFLLGGEKLQIIGGTFLGHRYVAPCLPFFLFTQLLGGAFLTDLFTEKHFLQRVFRPADLSSPMKLPLDGITPDKRRRVPVLVALATLLALIGDPRVVAARFRDQRVEFNHACADIEQMHIRIARWLAANTPPDAVVGVHDAGAIAYLSGRHTVDILGLNAPGATPLSPQAIARLDYLVTFPGPSVIPYSDRAVFSVTLPRPAPMAAMTMTVYRIRPATPGGEHQ